MKITWKRMYRYMPGSALILFGLMILAFPLLLVALISLFFIFAGIIVLFWASQLEKMEKDPLNEAAVWYRASAWPHRFKQISIFRL
jgi:uncharacterized membrane protein HdeD (DUF308 family)